MSKFKVENMNGMMGSEYDDIEKFPMQPIIINPTKRSDGWKVSDFTEVIADDVQGYLLEIKKKDEYFYLEIAKLVGYLASTYSEKYEDKESPNYSKAKLLSKDGKAANVFTALKYIQRYDTVGYSKSENPQDMLKAIHYILFEQQRKNKHA